MEKIILLGGGGHAKVLIDLIEISGKYEVAGILASQIEVGATILGISILDDDNLLPEFYKKGINNVSIAVGSTKDNSRRKLLYEKVKKIGFSVPLLLHPQAFISKNDTRISEGVQIMTGTIVQTGCLIGENTILNTGVIIEHDCNIGKHVHICPGAIISGGCTIGDGTFIGAGATVIQGINIGNNSIVAAGAVVVNDVADGKTVMGVPAKEWMSKRVNG